MNNSGLDHNHSSIILTLLKAVCIYRSQGSPVKLSLETFQIYYVYKLSCVLVSMKKYFAIADFQDSSDSHYSCSYYGLSALSHSHTRNLFNHN